MKFTLVAAVGLAALATTLTACSSGSGSGSATTTAAAAGTTSAAASSSAPSTPAAIATASGTAGSYLVDASGKALYILTSDKPNGGATACTVGCLKFWPPVAAPSPLPSGLSGITATFGTATAADGSSELTINGYPVYTFAKDTGPGTTAGQGVVSFGGTWWLVTPSGSWITAAASAPASSAKASTSGYGYRY